MTQRLLIIDDDLAIQELARQSLANWNTECIAALDGESGIKLAMEKKPNAILLDMNLPRMSGYEVCRRLMSNPLTESIPVIFLTATDTVCDKVLGREMGAVDYITKPFDPSEFRVRVRSALRRQRSLDEALSRVAVDELSGLFNAAYLEHRIEADLAAARRSGRPVACYFLAIDNWDGMAGTLASPDANEVVRQAAAAIVASVRQEDVVCRCGAATFGILAFVHDRPTASELGERVRSATSTALLACNVGIEDASVSMGVALSRFSFGKSLLGNAQEAMRDAQLNAKGTVRVDGGLLELPVASAGPPV